MQPQPRSFSTDPVAPLATGGFARGTEVMTLTGIRPVESLHKGDRIVTRTGARTLTSVTRQGNDRFVLGFDRPQVIFLAQGQAYSETGQSFSV